MISDLIDALQQQLTQALPGFSAHQKMMPALPKDFRQYKPDALTRQSAVLIALYPIHETLYFPLILRNEYEGVHSGQMGLPGGKKEKNDKDLMATALRESYEEIGILPEKVSILGELTEIFVQASNHLLLPIVGFMAEKPAFVPDSREVKAIFEINIEVLRNPAIIKTTTATLASKLTRQVPYFDLEKQVVWGATAMILSELIAVFQKIETRYTASNL
ncbi:MAG: CoA pyrophosphatase [Verrucomicrobia bacterium]|nr:CoA pyrophosphatase [Cytophagales bacterium]